MPMVIKRRYNVDSSVTSCLKVRIASRKSSFLLFKQTCSHDFTQAFLQEHNGVNPFYRFWLTFDDADVLY
jgi:hypothetical protein